MPGDKHTIEYVPEPSGVSMAAVGWAALAAIILLALAIGGLWGIYRAAVPTSKPSPPQAFPKPRVDTQEREELHRLRQAQEAGLQAWGWSDAEHTLVKVPIERAMQLLAARGKDAYAPLVPSSPEGAK